MDSHTVRETWANRSGEYSPAYYAHYGPNATSELLRERFDRHLDADASVLELGCSAGRHLAHLAEHGYRDVAGVDINADAFDVMAEHYPTLAADGTFYCGSLEELLETFEDGQFDGVYSVETLQHVHPDSAWVFEEVARITDDVLVTVENEGDADAEEGTGRAVNYVDDGLPLYYRNWEGIFDPMGLNQVDVHRGDRDVVRTFRVAE